MDSSFRNGMILGACLYFWGCSSASNGDTNGGRAATSLGGEGNGQSFGGQSASEGGGGAGTGGSASGAAGESGGTPGSSLTPPVDCEPYIPKAEELCDAENPCVEGECEGDTNPCLPADRVNFRTIVDTTEKLSALKGCTSLKGNLHFMGSELTNLAGLSLLTVRGDLHVTADALTSLEGLESLRSVTGNVILSGSTGAPLPLHDLSGLSGLRFVGGVLSINQAPALESLSGLGAGLIRHLMIENCPEFRDATAVSGACIGSISLINLPRLESLEQLPIKKDMEHLRLRGLPALSSLSGLERLERLKGPMSFVELPVLEDLRALKQLRAVGELQLTGVPGISDFAAFESLEYIGGALDIGDGAPTSLQGLSQLLYLGELKATPDTNPRIEDYRGLTALRAIQRLDTTKGVALDGLQTVQHVNIFITDGNVSLLPLEELEQVGYFSFAGTAPLPALPSRLHFIDSLRVAGTSSKNLETFDSVANIEGLSIAGTSGLETLTGFHHDGSLSGALHLSGCQALDLSVLSGLSSIGRELYVMGSEHSTLAGLENLDSVGSLSIADNDNLRDLDALSRLKTVKEYIYVRANGALGSVEGLFGLTAVGPDTSTPASTSKVFITENPLLPQCQVDVLHERFGPSVEPESNDPEALCQP